MTIFFYSHICKFRSDHRRTIQKPSNNNCLVIYSYWLEKPAILQNFGCRIYCNIMHIEFWMMLGFLNFDRYVVTIIMFLLFDWLSSLFISKIWKTISKGCLDVTSFSEHTFIFSLKFHCMACWCSGCVCSHLCYLRLYMALFGACPLNFFWGLADRAEVQRDKEVQTLTESWCERLWSEPYIYIYRLPNIEKHVKILYKPF